MSESITDPHGITRKPAGVADGAGGQFATPLTAEPPLAALSRERLDPLDGFPTGMEITDLGFAMIREGERLATVSRNADGSITVIEENPFDGATRSYIRGSDATAAQALAEATVAVTLAKQLIADDADFAHSISSLRYFDEPSTVTVTLKPTSTMPERLIRLDLDSGAVAVHTADEVGEKVADPEWCITRLDGSDSARGVALNLTDIVDLPDNYRWSAEEMDYQVTQEFVARVLTPLMHVPEHDLPAGTRAQRIVQVEESPQVAFATLHDSSFFDDFRAERAVTEMMSHASHIDVRQSRSPELAMGEARAYATAFAAVNLANNDPAAETFENERERILDQILRGNTPDVMPVEDIGVRQIERATGLMLRAVQRDVHTREPNRIEMEAAETLLAGVNGLAGDGSFTDGRTPRGTLSKIIGGMPLSDDRLMNPEHEPDEVFLFSAPRRKPRLGIWV